jgi:MtN3 and saliva related transmembrane protein
MQDILITVLGISATVLSSVSLMPQVIRTWRTRSTGDISALYLIVNLTASAIWIGYGSLIGSVALVVVNLIGFTQAASILFIKLRYQAATAMIAESH